MKNKTLVFTAVAVLLAGCSKEAAVPQDVNSSLVPLSVTSTSLSAVVTKSAITAGGTIGVFLAADAPNGYAAVNNVKYEYTDNNKWENKTGNNIYLNNNPATICAYYPYGATGSGADPTNFSLNSQLYNATADLCYAANLSPKPTNSSASVSFSMQHAYSMITLNIKNLTYGGVAKISGIKILNPSLRQVASLNITNGVCTNGDAVSTLSFDPVIASVDTYNASDLNTIKKVGLLILPVQSLTNGNLTFSFNIDGTERTTAGVSLAGLSQGSNYTIDVTLNGTDVSVSSAAVTDWTEVPIPDAIHPHR
jgi:hypothetical protein